MTAGHGCQWWAKPPRRELRVPEPLAAWVVGTRSLTAAMRRQWPETFEVRVLSQRWCRPAVEEARRLGVRQARWAWVREVVLLGAGRPMIVARSVIPGSGCAGELRALRRLGTRPLGDRLFVPGRSCRDPLEVAALRPGNWLSNALSGYHAEVAQARWARRAVHRLDDHSLLVTEVFLPALVTDAVQGAT
jgi:chorismate lyase